MVQIHSPRLTKLEALQRVPLRGFLLCSPRLPPHPTATPRPERGLDLEPQLQPASNALVDPVLDQPCSRGLPCRSAHDT